MTDQTLKDIDRAFRALEERDELLDKIRAEIEQLKNFRAEDYDLEQYCDCFDTRIIFRDDVLKIIDRYRERANE